MNKLIPIVILSVAAIAAMGAEVVTNATTAAAALSDETLKQLVAQLYANDMKTVEGRARWHGAKVSDTLDVSNAVRITRFKDGTEFRDPATVKSDAKTRLEASKKKLKYTVTTNGVPKALAEARKRRAVEVNAESNVTITVKAGGKK